MSETSWVILIFDFWFLILDFGLKFEIWNLAPVQLQNELKLEGKVFVKRSSNAMPTSLPRGIITTVLIQQVLALGVTPTAWLITPSNKQAHASRKPSLSHTIPIKKWLRNSSRLMPSRFSFPFLLGEQKDAYDPPIQPFVNPPVRFLNVQTGKVTLLAPFSVLLDLARKSLASCPAR